MRSLGMQLIIHLPDERIRQIQEAWHWDRVTLGTNHDFVSADNQPVHNRGLSPFSHELPSSSSDLHFLPHPIASSVFWRTRRIPMQ